MARWPYSKSSYFPLPPGTVEADSAETFLGVWDKDICRPPHTRSAERALSPNLFLIGVREIANQNNN
jgi:hypothetical protein